MKFTGSESELQKTVERWFERIEMPYYSHPSVGRGNTDIGLAFSQTDQRPMCLLELKTGLSVDSKVKDLSGHFEQCLKYHLASKLPVFLGPFFIGGMGVLGYLGGGEEPRHATGAFSAFAGRANIGLMFINCEPGYEGDQRYWYGLRMTMRQKTVARWHKDETHYVWPTQPIELVDLFDSAASKSVRGTC